MFAPGDGSANSTRHQISGAETTVQQRQRPETQGIATLRVEHPEEMSPASPRVSRDRLFANEVLPVGDSTSPRCPAGDFPSGRVAPPSRKVVEHVAEV